MITDEYIKEINAAYWAEEEEMKAGIHPSQVRERIEKALYDMGHQYEEISFLDWNVEGPRVKVSTNGKFFGIFNYETNKFETEEKKVNSSLAFIASALEHLLQNKSEEEAKELIKSIFPQPRNTQQEDET